MQNIVDDFLRQEGFISSNGPCLDADDSIPRPIDASQPNATGTHLPLVSTASHASPVKRPRLTEISDNIAIRPVTYNRQIDKSKPVTVYPEVSGLNLVCPQTNPLFSRPSPFDRPHKYRRLILPSAGQTLPRCRPFSSIRGRVTRGVQLSTAALVPLLAAMLRWEGRAVIGMLWSIDPLSRGRPRLWESRRRPDPLG